MKFFTSSRHSRVKGYTGTEMGRGVSQSDKSPKTPERGCTRSKRTGHSGRTRQMCARIVPPPPFCPRMATCFRRSWAIWGICPPCLVITGASGRMRPKWGKPRQTPTSHPTARFHALLPSASPTPINRTLAAKLLSHLWRTSSSVPDCPSLGGLTAMLRLKRSSASSAPNVRFARRRRLSDLTE